MRNPQTAILLAAGRGKRLRPHTDLTPKPLLAWKGRPTLDWILDSLESAGIQRVVLVVGHLKEQIIEYSVIRQQLKPSMTLSCIEQKTLDGTAGAVSIALDANPEWFRDSFLVTATDYLVDERFYPDLLAFHRQHAADISVSLKKVPEAELSKRSSVAYTGDFDITEVVEKPADGKAPSPYSANLIYVLPAQIASLIHRVAPATRGEREIQSAVNQYLANGHGARGLLQPTPDEWVPAQS